MIIEEIAGIGIYEEKKQQALNDLQKVEEKLLQAEIILKERDGFLKDLKKDRDQALKYKQLSDNLKRNKASLLHRQMERKQTEQQTFEKKTSKMREGLERTNVKLQSLREQIISRRDRMRIISAEIEQKGEVEMVKLQKELEHLRVEIATHRTKAHALQQEAARSHERKNQLAKTVESVEEQLARSQKQSEELQETCFSLDKQAKDIEHAILSFKQKHGLGEEAAGIEQEISKIDAAADTVLKESQQLREEQQNLLREKDKTEFQLRTIDEQIAKVRRLEDEHRAEIDALRHKKDEFKKVILELNEVLNTDSKQAAELAHARQRVVQLRDEATKLDIKNTRIQEMIADNMAVKKVLENRAQLGAVYGTVAELGQADKEYALALEVAAAQRLQSIVVEDDRTAAACINYLKKGQFGVATFLPLNKIRPVAARDEVKKFLDKDGVRGLAIDLIEFDPKFRTVFSHVFGNTLVVDNLSIARGLGIGTIRMVTLDGDLAETSGAMTGGHRHKKVGSFKEKGIGAKLADLNEEISDLEVKISRLEESRKQHDERITRLREVKATLEGDIIKGERALHMDTSDLEANEKYKDDLGQAMKKADDRLAALQDLLVEKTRDLTQLKIKKQDLRNKIAELRNPRVLAELNAYEQKHKELRESHIRMEGELKNAQRECDERQKELTNAEAVMTSLSKEASEHTRAQNELETKATADETIAKARDRDMEQFREQFKGLFTERNLLADEVTKLENEVFAQEDASRKQEMELNCFAVEEARVKAEMAGYQAEFSQYEGIALDTETTEDKMRKEVADFEKMLANIGAVNLRALDIYDTAEKEYQSLLEKKDILVKEKEDVLNLMATIEARKTDLFLQTYRAIAQNFVTNFQQLSHKGEAELELENPAKPFEGGLTMKVRITGDKFLDIRSLSGGEKTMTALAFLFAIQDHEPAPFYVLDEVDAALDKANSEKLAKLIRRYTQRAQYIVISHNDALLTEADTLYGVSMNEHGVSQVISIRAGPP